MGGGGRLHKLVLNRLNGLLGKEVESFLTSPQLSLSEMCDGAIIWGGGGGEGNCLLVANGEQEKKRGGGFLSIQHTMKRLEQNK